MGSLDNHLTISIASSLQCITTIIIIIVHNDSLKFSAIMERCAKILNLAPHPAGVDAAARRTLHTASDVEGHIGLVGRVLWWSCGSV